MTQTASRRQSLVQLRQQPLIDRYHEAPAEALITDRAKTRGGLAGDPFHGRVVVGREDHGVEVEFGIHRAVGGDHDAPNPGDLLCAGLAACMDATLRMVADRMGVELVELEVEVTAHADVRGTLLIDRECPVGFQRIDCKTRLRGAEGTNPQLLHKLEAIAEQCCVNYQTLRAGTELTSRW
jgi:uncharacterized OsmC-like protein